MTAGRKVLLAGAVGFAIAAVGKDIGLSGGTIRTLAILAGVSIGLIKED